jgi:hypothetical protein
MDATSFSFRWDGEIPFPGMSMRPSMRDEPIILLLWLGFGLNPFGDLHQRHHRFAGRSQPSSRLDSHRQQMALFDDFFSPMRMSVFDRDPFANHFSPHNIGTISSFNVSFGGGSRPVAKKTTKSTKMINGRRVVTTR